MTVALAEYHGIEGLQGKEPVGAVLSIGLKRPDGKIQPGSNDAFFVKRVYPDKGGVRPLHPDFTRYNSLPKEERALIRGNIVHVTRDDAWDHQLKAQVLPGDKWPAHPGKLPACVGDGVRAMRYYGKAEGGDHDFREIECPHELCEFRQGKAPSCKPYGRLYFRPNWRKMGLDLPPLLMKWDTRSWNNVKSFVGFWEYVEAQAASMGLKEAVIYGLPFVLGLERKTNPEQKTSFPVVSVTVDGDLLAFFAYQRKQIEEAGGALQLPASAGARDPEENDPETLAVSFVELQPGMPGEVVTPPEPEPDEAPETEPPAEVEYLPAAEVNRLCALASRAKDEDVFELVQTFGGEHRIPTNREHEFVAALKRLRPAKR